MLDPRDLAPDVFAARARELGAHDLSIRRLIAAVVGRGIHDPVIWGRDFQVPRRLREAIVYPLPRLKLERIGRPRRSTAFKKLLFRTEDGLAVETVLIPLHKPGAVSLCLSSQVGCADGLRLLRHRPDDAAAQPGDLGDHRPVHPGSRDRAMRRAGG